MVLALAGFAQLSFGQASAVEIGFTDHSLITGFAYSEIIERELERDINHQVVLGALERVRGEVIPEDSERLRGDVTKINYEISEEFSGADVYQFFQEQLESRNYEVLFSCEGRACGSSNYWANDVFRNRILYGPERNQYYMAFRSRADVEDAPYFSLYIITRVNRKIYAYIEVIEPGGTQDPEQIAAIQEPQVEDASVSSGASSGLLQQLREQGSVILPEIDFQSNDRLPASLDIASLAAALQADASVSVYLVAHLSQEGRSLEELMERSAARASSLRQALIAAGISAERIEAAGVGPLAPSCAVDNCASASNSCCAELVTYLIKIKIPHVSTDYF